MWSCTLVTEGSFEAIRFRHSKLETDEVVRASFRLLEFVPRVGELVNLFRFRSLEPRESWELAEHSLALRYGSRANAPVEAGMLLKARRAEDEGTDLWTTMNQAESDSRRRVGLPPEPSRKSTFGSGIALNRL